MKKSTIRGVYPLSVFLILLLAVTVKVSALSVDVSTSAKLEGGDSSTSVNASATGSVKSQNSSPATGSATSSAKSSGAEGDAQKSAVALVVKSLLSIADRDGGIGADVRLVAQEQASTSAKVKIEMDELNSESKVKVFFFGPNYRNLGELRSSIVTTQNHIARLKKAEERTTSASVKADLEVQIKALQVQASTTESFVLANENKLSLLGWFVHIFVR
jgi:hypothetical protein